MKNKGFTLVELLAVIAILAILVIIALPNVLSMFNRAKKDTFLTEAKNIYKEISKKYINETMRGNKITNISNTNNKLDLESDNLKYNIKLDNFGNIKKFQVSNDTYCVSGKFNNLSELTTDKIVEGKCEETSPKDFFTDDWETIIDAVREGNNELYNVGDEKEIELDGYGKHKIRIANKSTPSECSTSNFSQTACGFVLEFTDVITNHAMNGTDTNVGGWPVSSMRAFANNDIFNSLPQELKEIIIQTKVVSGYGSNDTSNFVTNDKIYLLSGKEIYQDYNDFDESTALTRTLDYYKNKNNTLKAPYSSVKKNGTSKSFWWLRSAATVDNVNFYFIKESGDTNGAETTGYLHFGNASRMNGVSPAFRIG